ncbi:MAG: Gx transporter family protein [Candidatus Cryosericum sp.]|nr:Gx transporter family protein [bacterium]
MLSPNSKRPATQTVLRFALLIAVAIAINYFDPPLPFLPGAKLGLSQISTMLCLEMYGTLAAVALVILRVLATGIIKGNLMTITSVLSLGGSLGAVVVMVLVRKVFGRRVGLPTISTIGGVCNNVSQYLLLLITHTVGTLWYYLPALVIAGGAAGYLIGGVSLAILSRLDRALHGGIHMELW